MKNENGFPLVVFDVYGTLIAPPRSPSPHAMFFALLSRAGVSGFDPKDCMRDGLTMTGFAKKLDASGLSREAWLEVEALEKAAEALANECSPFPEVPAALQALNAAGVKWGLCSNLARPYGCGLDKLGSKPAFSSLSFETGVLKPDPEAVLRFLDKGQVVRRMVVVGDSAHSDGGLARGLNASFVLVDRNGRHPGFVGKDSIRVSNITEAVGAILMRGPV